MILEKQSVLQESKITQLITMCNDEAFINSFAKDPEGALRFVDMDLETFSNLLSANNSLYQTFVDKLSGIIDLSQLTISASSCCDSITNP